MRKHRVSLDKWHDYYCYLYAVQNKEVGTSERYRLALKKFVVLCIEKELTQIQKEIMIAYFWDKKFMKDIAEERGINISTISRHISTAKKRIGDKLDYFNAIYEICNQED